MIQVLVLYSGRCPSLQVQDIQPRDIPGQHVQQVAPDLPHVSRIDPMDPPTGQQILANSGERPQRQQQTNGAADAQAVEYYGAGVVANLFRMAAADVDRENQRK